MGKIKGKYIEDDAIDEANLELEAGPTNDFVLTADSAKSGGMKWAPTGIHTQGTDTTLGTMTADINMDGSFQLINLQAPAASGEAIRQTTNVTETNLNELTGTGDTTLHDHDGIDENTTARHTQNTDTALGSGAVAADHGTAATDQIINVCYGTSATPPTASTTTEGTLYIQHAA